MCVGVCVTAGVVYVPVRTELRRRRGEYVSTKNLIYQHNSICIKRDSRFFPLMLQVSNFGSHAKMSVCLCFWGGGGGGVV